MIIRCVWFLEKRLWGDSVQGNPCFSSLVMALSLFLGALLGAKGFLHEIVPAYAALNGVAIAGLLVILLGFLLFESICVARGVEVIMPRMLLLQLLAVLMAVVGYFVGLTTLFIAVVWLLLLLADILCHMRV